ncbi:MAG: hypothetical protein EBT07_01775 [Actinobacteria bacterium]|nr:hypothetical protein [Actinomycetota bacterium]
MANKKKPVKADPPATLAIKVPGKTAREVHRVYKKPDGNVIVDHAQRGGKNDKFNLTKLAGAKTVQQGVKAVQKYHRTKGMK